MPPEPSEPDRLEALLAEALAAHDQGGDAALQSFLGAHPDDRPGLERGLLRCRQLGLLGAAAPRDFPERLGEFRLLRRLGGGGMGVVYEAEQESLGRRVALKVVRPELLWFEGARERFRREIEAVARLSHPAVVPVLASGEQDGVPWFAMELLPGRTMHELCEWFAGRDPASLRGDDLRQALGIETGSGTDAASGPWWQVAVRLVHGVALGVRHAHLRGIVHRDIKPSNVMLTPDGRAVLLDFGVARLGGGREFTRTGHAPGSPAFMSPEQLRGEAVDERTDVYSLGATLWQLLALVPPFRGDADLDRIRAGDLPSLAAHNREVPRELVLVVQKAMDRDRERRYGDVEAFADDLAAVLQRRPIRARRLGLGLRTVRWCQRHRVLATAIGTLLAVGLTLPVVFAWREASVNRDLAAAVQRANDSLRTTLEALWSQVVRVADERLRHVPGADRHVRESLQQAVAHYRALLPAHPEDERLRGNFADALVMLADLRARQGDPDEAARLLGDAIGLFPGEAATVPRGGLIKRAGARTVLAGLFAQRGDRDAARAECEAADAELALAAAEPRFRVDVRRQRIEVAKKRVGLRDPVGEAAAAEQDLVGAIALARAVIDDKPDNLLDRARLVQLLDDLATRYGRQGRDDEALVLLDEALALARALPSDEAMWPPPPKLVSDVLLTLGNLHVRRRDQRAVAALQECVQLREALVRDHARDVLLRSELGAALHGLANLNHHQTQPELVVERLERAIALQREALAAMPTFATARQYLRNHLRLYGNALVALGRAAQLHEVARELSAMAGDAAALRGAAWQWLRLAGFTAAPGSDGLPSPAQCHERALQALLAAEQAGWGNGNPLGGAVYEPLRALPEFEALQRRVAARAGAAAPDTGR